MKYLFIVIISLAMALSTYGQRQAIRRHNQNTTTHSSYKKIPSKNGTMSTQSHLTEQEKKEIIDNIFNNMIYVEGNGHYFYMAKHPVTISEWKAVLGKSPNYATVKGNAITNISYNDCMDFIFELTKKTGRPFRLLEGNEWDIAYAQHNSLFSGNIAEWVHGPYADDGDYRYSSTRGHGRTNVPETLMVYGKRKNLGLRIACYGI